MTKCNNEAPAPQFVKTEDPGYPYLEVKELHKSFEDRSGKGEIFALKEVSFTVKLGEITAIIGQSGSGKSTLLRCIYGLLKVDQGEISFRGVRVKGPDEQLIPGHALMRMVSQHFEDLNTYANVWDNVAAGLSNTDLQSKKIKTEAALNRLRISHLWNQRVVDLSGGEKQRVAIARALITNPEVLLMDEPFNQIDSSFRDQLQKDLKKLVLETGLTVILVSHDPAEVMGLADYLILLQKGEVSAMGTAEDLYQYPPNAYVASIFTKSNILSPAQSYYLGLQARLAAVHPEWLVLYPDANGDFLVEEVLFRGFYEEIFIRNESLNLRVIQLANRKIKKGEKVDIQLTKFVYLNEA